MRGEEEVGEQEVEEEGREEDEADEGVGDQPRVGDVRVDVVAERETGWMGRGRTREGQLCGSRVGTDEDRGELTSWRSDLSSAIRRWGSGARMQLRSKHVLGQRVRGRDPTKQGGRAWSLTREGNVRAKPTGTPAR